MDVDGHGPAGHGAACGCAHPQSTQHLSSFPLDHCTGRKKALLIGIKNSKTGNYRELAAAHSDVDKMRGLLLDIYNYTPAEITLLLDDGMPGHVQPTRVNILAAIADLVRDVKEGDQLFFHYSGHSTQVENPHSNSEEDGMDECLVPLDGEDQMIVDNELHKTLVKPLPLGSHLVAVLDTCHSGSLLDLKHYRCNRVPVPWLWRGKRNSEPIRNAVVRRGARLLTLSETTGPTQQAPNAPNPRRRSVISVLCDPAAPAAPSPNSRSSTGNSPKSLTGSAGPLARLRTASVLARRKLSVVLPDHDSDQAKDTDTEKGKDKENLMQRAATKLHWILSDDKHCDSPVSRFPCSGWCRNVDRRMTEGDEDADDVRADVISLASCKDSQLAWEEGGISMTSSLVDLLRENPHQSLKEVLIRVSHATYSLALTRHGRAQEYKRKQKAYIAWLMTRIARFENRPTSTVSLSLKRPPPPPPPPALAPQPKPTTRAAPKGLARRMCTLRSLKKTLQDARKSKGGDMNNFQNPELASPRPLDMNRPWRM
ncbi:caspase domain-containing protein [Mycena polygramma]|nr:caspase domain-containing protein [Mycena polygramma]